MTLSPEQIYKDFKKNADNFISAEETYKSALLNPAEVTKAQIKIDSARFFTKTLKAICGVK